MNQDPPVFVATIPASAQGTPAADAKRALLLERMLAHVEPTIALSTEHLHPTSRQRLADGSLSTVSYPNEYGGFVYVGDEENEPSEPELATIFQIVRSADIVWIKFDKDVPAVEDLPTFENPLWTRDHELRPSR